MIFIRKGTHAPFRLPALWRGETIVFRGRFTESCRYVLPGADQADWNKLFGFGFSWDHHKNSVRWGWRYYAGRMQLAVYIYDNGQRLVPVYMDAPTGHFKCALSYTMQGRAIFLLDGKEVYSHHVGKNPFGFRLNPYFGGNRVAPQNIIIDGDITAV